VAVAAHDDVRYSITILQEFSFIERRNEAIGESGCITGPAKTGCPTREVVSNGSRV